MRQQFLFASTLKFHESGLDPIAVNGNPALQMGQTRCSCPSPKINRTFSQNPLKETVVFSEESVQIGASALKAETLKNYHGENSMPPLSFPPLHRRHGRSRHLAAGDNAGSRSADAATD
jgi:hypothetical protein